MKLVAGIFFLTLIWSSQIMAQENRLFLSLEEAMTVSPDSVYQLDLTKAKLDSFPNIILNFKNLTWLSLSKTKLSDLPDDFYFSRLMYLDISKNDFEVFPPEICEIRSLRTLHIQKNNIKELPPCIGQLTKLEKFDAWFNGILTIPDEFINLRALRFVDFRGMTYTNEFQKKWVEKMPWVNFEFDLGCDCGN